MRAQLAPPAPVTRRRVAGDAALSAEPASAVGAPGPVSGVCLSVCKPAWGSWVQSPSSREGGCLSKSGKEQGKKGGKTRTCAIATGHPCVQLDTWRPSCEPQRVLHARRPGPGADAQPHRSHDGISTEGLPPCAVWASPVAKSPHSSGGPLLMFRRMWCSCLSHTLLVHVQCPGTGCGPRWGSEPATLRRADLTWLHLHVLALTMFVMVGADFRTTVQGL